MKNEATRIVRAEAKRGAGDSSMSMRQGSPEPARKARLTEQVHGAVAAMVADRGEVQTARALGVSRATVLRGLAGLALTYSTRTTIETCLSRMAGRE